MAVILNSSRDNLQLGGDKQLWAYNALDCCVTFAVADALRPEVEERAAVPYHFVRAMQGPALDMTLRGIAVDPIQREKERRQLTADRARAQQLLDRLSQAVWGRGEPRTFKSGPRKGTTVYEQESLNANSPTQLIAFFYTALDLPRQFALRKTPTGKVRTLSVDHKALETLAKIATKGPGISPYDRSVEKVNFAAPFVSLITTIRDAGKKLAVVNAKTGADGRMRFAYNVVGTLTWRWSSSSTAFDEGTNGQNITDRMRRMFVADDGWKLASPDLEQAEARVVAGMVWAVTGDDSYWRACESGDLHTINATMAWPELPWPGHWDAERGEFVGDLKAARAMADKKWYRHLSYRDGSKRIGHGTNFDGPPMGIAGMIGIPTSIVSDFQRRYFAAHPSIRAWHLWTRQQLQTTHRLTNPFDCTRHFFGRVWEDSAVREAMAHIPQSTIGLLLNCMLSRVYERTLRDPAFASRIQLLLQVHDSIVFQFPDPANRHPALATPEQDILDEVAALMHVPIPITRIDGSETRELVIPLEWKTGWNWSAEDPNRETHDDGNPEGLRKWRGRDDRRRTSRARPSAADILACK